MAFNPATKPLPLGLVSLVTPGTGVRLTSVLDASVPADGSKAYGNTSSSDDLWANKIDLSAPSGNAVNIYIGFIGMNKTTLVGVLKILEPGQEWSLTNPVGMNTYRVGELAIDADSGTPGVYGSCDVV